MSIATQRADSWMRRAAWWVALAATAAALVLTNDRAEASTWDASPPSLPDTPVIDQHGKPHRFYTDLVKGRTVAINFVFTTCTSTCPPATAIFRRAQQDLSVATARADITLISISVDSMNDTPEKLRQFAARFEAGPGWLFLTGKKNEIDGLLTALGAFGNMRDDHSPLVLIGNDAAARWTHLHGLAPAATLVATLNEAANLKRPSRAATSVPAAWVHATAAGPEAAVAIPRAPKASYFTNLPLLDQNGARVRFYDDMISGHIVLINAMFTGCSSVCSPVTANLHQAQRTLGDTLGDRVRFISVTVDPLNDTPAVLKAFAKRHNIEPQLEAGALPRWSFLTGKRENVDWVLYKLGAYTEAATDHSTVLLIGNDLTGEWVKLIAMAEPAEIVRAVRRLAAARPL